MIIDILPKTELLVREDIQCGRFRSVDDWIVSDVRAWRKRDPVAHPVLTSHCSLYFLMKSLTAMRTSSIF